MIISKKNTLLVVLGILMSCESPWRKSHSIALDSTGAGFFIDIPIGSRKIATDSLTPVAERLYPNCYKRDFNRGDETQWSMFLLDDHEILVFKGPINNASSAPFYDVDGDPNWPSAEERLETLSHGISGHYDPWEVKDAKIRSVGGYDLIWVRKEDSENRSDGCIFFEAVLTEKSLGKAFLGKFYYKVDRINSLDKLDEIISSAFDNL